MGTLVIILVTFLICLFIGVPVAFSLGTASLIYLLFIQHLPLVVFAQVIYGGIESFLLLSVPLYILAGNLLNSAEMTGDLVSFCRLFLGRIRGSLAHVTIGAEIVFSGITGSAVADAAALGTVLIPGMVKEGYKLSYAAAVAAAASTLGPIIPPSILMIVYASIIEISVVKLFAAGLLPGSVMALLLMAMAYIYAVRVKQPKSTIAFTLKTLIDTTKRAIPALLMPLIILGGLFLGIFTPTESAAIAVAYATLFGLVSRKLTWRKIVNDLYETMVDTAGILVIVAAAKLFAWVLTLEHIPQQVTTYFITIGSTPATFLLISIIIMLIMGCFLDLLANLILLAPILVPVAVKLGIDPLHFAMVLILGLTIGLVTPPFGMCLFTISTIGKVPLEEVVRSIWPFIMILVVSLLLVAYIPAITLILPNILFR